VGQAEDVGNGLGIERVLGGDQRAHRMHGDAQAGSLVIWRRPWPRPRKGRANDGRQTRCSAAYPSGAEHLPSRVRCL
jgi:hypothetical protein